MTDIEKLRSLLNMTQERFAEKLGVSARTVQNWEAGGNVPKTKFSTLQEMAAQFPNEKFVFIEAKNSPGAGENNDVRGINSQDLKRILDSINEQRKDFLAEMARKDAQIDRLIALLEKR